MVCGSGSVVVGAQYSYLNFFLLVLPPLLPLLAHALVYSNKIFFLHYVSDHDPLSVITDEQSSNLATSLGFSAGTPSHQECKSVVEKLYTMFRAHDCTLVVGSEENAIILPALFQLIRISLTYLS